MFFYDIVRLKTETNTPSETELVENYVQEKANLSEFYNIKPFEEVKSFNNQVCKCITCYSCSKQIFTNTGKLSTVNVRQLSVTEFEKYWNGAGGKIKTKTYPYNSYAIYSVLSNHESC